MSGRSLAIAFLVGLFGANSPLRAAADDVTSVISGKIHHLGDSDKPAWKEFTSAKPQGRTLELKFDLRRPKVFRSLEFEAGGVGDAWQVRVNKSELGKLEKGDSRRTQVLKVPAGILKAKNNVLVIALEKGKKSSDDIYVGRLTLHSATAAKLLKFAEISVEVRDSLTGSGLPCRLTVVRLSPADREGTDREELAELEVEESERLATRRGIVYTMDGNASFGLRAGKYRVYATRGFEYSLASTIVDVEPEGEAAVRLTLEREVDTTGYLAADTHIHTLTYSKHGDASVEERVVTIAGEGVEIAVATDHNHHTDYAPVAREVGVADRFLPVVGNEFTTKIGHFNAFPIDKDAKPADHTHKDWVKLLRALRATPGVRVVICNHPRRPKFKDSAFGKIGLNPYSGETHQGPAWLGLDAVEVMNGKTLEDDPMLTLRDWFGLLNRGHRLAAVAGSDSHTVGGVVGQARTYVRSSTDDPRTIRVDEVVESFHRGRLLVSLGLLADLEVNRRFRVGDLATGLGPTLDVSISVTGPRWIKADHVALYLNGQLAREKKIQHGDGVVKLSETWSVPAPRHDAHLVVVASGPPLSGLYWAPPQDKKYVLGATNPVWLDVDGDGQFACAVELASRLVEKHGTDASTLRPALADYDEAVKVQVASLVRAKMQTALQAAYDKLYAKATQRLEEILGTQDSEENPLVGDYLKLAPPLTVVPPRAGEPEQPEDEVAVEDEEAAPGS